MQAHTECRYKQAFSKCLSERKFFFQHLFYAYSTPAQINFCVPISFSFSFSRSIHFCKMSSKILIISGNPSVTVSVIQYAQYELQNVLFSILMMEFVDTVFSTTARILSTRIFWVSNPCILRILYFIYQKHKKVL